MTNLPFTLRWCLWLCLPALIIGAVIRLCFLVAVPEALNGADTRSYTQTSDNLWLRHSFHVGGKRRWLYPILMIPLPALPLSPARSIPILQHVLGLATVFGIGWIVGNLTVLRNVWVPAVTTLAAVWPKMLRFEHEVVADCVLLAAFVLTVSLAMPAGSLRDRKRLFWFLVSAAVVASVKPHGRGIWFACLVFAALVTRDPHRWGWKCWRAVIAGVLVILTSGEKRQGNWLLLSSVLPLVNLDGQTWKEYRQELAPIVLKERKVIDQYPWRQGLFKKPLSDHNPAAIGPAWAALTNRNTEFAQVAGDLGREAVFHHPFMEARFTLTKIGISLVHDSYADSMVPQAFLDTAKSTKDQRWLENEPELRFFYRMDRQQHEKAIAQWRLRSNPTVPFLRWVSRSMPFADDHVDPETQRHWLTAGWVGILALFGLLVCLTPSRFLDTMVVWLPSILCLVTVHAIGDRNSQYVVPVEWAGWALAAIGLDAVLILALRLVKKSFSAMPAPVPLQVAPLQVARES